MNVFLSWSGTKSYETAAVLRRWLHDVIHTVTPWLSEEIPAGARWQIEIADHINHSHFGIICLTRNNKDAPWLLFEAGALARAIQDSSNLVCPYLIDLDLRDLSGHPLEQFQSKQANKDGTWQIIKALNKAMQNSPLTEADLMRSFERWWPDLDKVLRELPPDDSSQGRSQSADSILERLFFEGLGQFSARLDALIDKVDSHHNAVLQLVNNARRDSFDDDK